MTSGVIYVHKSMQIMYICHSELDEKQESNLCESPMFGGT